MYPYHFGTPQDFDSAQLPATLPPAQLPQTYQAAKAALAECEQLDEAAEWANKALALSSYAAQARDDSLRVMADRIRARAVRRCGELLREIDARGDHMKKDANGLSRKQVAEEAGLSERQSKTAVRVANIPTDDFEKAVESARPPTITKLALVGTQSRESERVGLNADDFRHINWRHFMWHIDRLCRTAKHDNPADLVAGITPRQLNNHHPRIKEVLGFLNQIDRLLEQRRGLKLVPTDRAEE